MFVEPTTEILQGDYIHREEPNDWQEIANSSGDRARLLQPVRLTLRYFTYRHARYVWNSTHMTFVRLHGLDRGHSVRKFTSYLNGLTKEEQAAKRLLYGLNAVNIEVKSYLTLFVQEVRIW